MSKVLYINDLVMLSIINSMITVSYSDEVVFFKLHLILSYWYGETKNITIKIEARGT